MINKKLLNLRFSQGLLGILFLFFLIATVALSHNSVITPAVRIVTAVTVLCGLLSFALYIIRVLLIFPSLRFPAALVVAFAFIWILIYERTIDTHQMRDLYMKQLLTYGRARYVSGGETMKGVDEAGLARAAFWKAMLQYGFREVSPQMLGPGLWRFWWTDVSSKDLVISKHGFTSRIDPLGKILPGDLAVSSNRVMIFLDEDQWMEADSQAKKVVIHKTKPPQDSVYLRWWILREK